MRSILFTLAALILIHLHPFPLLAADRDFAAPPSGAKVYARMLPVHVGTLARFDFSDPHSWPEKAPAFSLPGGTLTLAEAKVGTVDAAGSMEPSGGLLFSAKTAHSGRVWSAGFVSGKLPIRSTETNPQKLTLSFSLSSSSTRPVTISIESFNSEKRRTGGLETQIFPAAPECYQRYALDLYNMKKFGAGQFRPTDPFVQFTFAVHSDPNESALPTETAYELRLDNVNYASPAYYVRPEGSDKSDGRTEKTAFATPQKALDAAEPGDIILLMNGTYRAAQTPVASFPRPGAPDAWIVLKNYPGHHPILTSNGWNIVSISQGSNGQYSDLPALAYLEVRGLHVRGEGDVAKQKFPEAMNKPDPRTNTNGIAVDGRFTKNVPHHLRIADNLVEYCPGCGIGTLESDWVTIENNTCRFNSWTTIYATSGISILGASNFDATDNIYKMLIRNNISYRNETYEIWKAVNHISDGNGIIIDVNQKTDSRPTSTYQGRTLVQSNLCFDNGGSGIHTFRANRVDIINNTAYLNSASKALQYPQIFANASDDVRIMNNILVAPVADIAAGEKPESVNQLAGKNTNVILSHNLYFGGNIAPILGEGDIIADPQFMNPSRDSKVADFHLLPTSPALGKGITVPYAPRFDLDGKLLRHNRGPDVGAYAK